MAETTVESRSSASRAKAAFPARASPQKRERLIRRFAATIGRSTPLKLTHYDVLGSKVIETIGLPERALQDVLYVMIRPGHMRAVPAINLIDIQRLYP